MQMKVVLFRILNQNANVIEYGLSIKYYKGGPASMRNFFLIFLGFEKSHLIYYSYFPSFYSYKFTNFRFFACYLLRLSYILLA